MEPGMHSQAQQINAHGREARRLLAEGLVGTARIVGARDTGQRLAGNHVLDLELAVTVAGDAPYATVVRVPIAGSDTAPYVVGRQLPVRIDPADRTKLAFG